MTYYPSIKRVAYKVWNALNTLFHLSLTITLRDVHRCLMLRLREQKRRQVEKLAVLEYCGSEPKSAKSTSRVFNHWSLPTPVSQMRKPRLRNDIAGNTQLVRGVLCFTSPLKVKYKLNFSYPICPTYSGATVSKILYSVL